VKHFDLRPVDVSATGERLKELELRRTCRDEDARRGPLPDGARDRRCRLVSRRLSELAFVVED
jgi:hypothetical protein